MKDYFQKIACYNQWANSRLYEACGQLPTDEYMENRKAFFGSIHGTLNHLLAVDRLWLGRIKEIDTGVASLDQILYTDFETLLHERKNEDTEIIAFIEQLEPSKINDIIRYKTLSGKENSMSLRWLLSHLFNHQTHHRGQVHNMLSQANISPPPIDIYYFLLE